MKKTAVIYWSGTGNTEAMAKAVLEGMKEAGAEAVLLTPAEAKNFDIGSMDAVAFGCPAMGAEELEDTEFAPIFDACKGKIQSKKIALFGSYGWGDGEWMRTWENDCETNGMELAHKSVTCCETPNEAALYACRELGKAIAE